MLRWGDVIQFSGGISCAFSGAEALRVVGRRLGVLWGDRGGRELS